MRRRRLLGLTAGVAGLSGYPDALSDARSTPTPTPDDLGTVAGVELPVSER
jgi:hypothetical protein